MGAEPSAERQASLNEFSADGAIEIREHGGRAALFAAPRKSLSLTCARRITF
jgi:hypothetical protein